MATEQNTTSKRGMVHREYSWGHFYHGTKDELVGTGIFNPEWMPGEKGNKKTTSTIKGKALGSLSSIAPEISMVHIYRKDSSRRHFDAHVSFTEDERQRRGHIQELEKANKRALELAQKWLNDCPDSVERYKKQTAWRITTIAEILCENAAKDGGYYLEDETNEKLHQAIKVLNEIIMAGPVGYSAVEHEQKRIASVKEAFDRHIAPLIDDSDKADNLQRFMADLQVA